ncbi:hypothetical protein R1flu_015652 [Riccia fluitans]|uniref:Uncharacterized protein n=1 Tax=Riccia fluitans TaxID=41844 RepID=A0ABD1YK18_9MARC
MCRPETRRVQMEQTGRQTERGLSIELTVTSNGGDGPAPVVTSANGISISTLEVPIQVVYEPDRQANHTMQSTPPQVIMMAAENVNRAPHAQMGFGQQVHNPGIPNWGRSPHPLIWGRPPRPPRRPSEGAFIARPVARYPPWICPRCRRPIRGLVDFEFDKGF